MSLSPDSFDRLLADKLAQAPPPAYEPAHWDQLEDQLQHLNQALQQQAVQHATTAAPASAPVAAVAPLAGKLAAIGFGALLTGLTAVNGYLFYATTAARPTEPIATTIVAPAPTIPTVASAADSQPVAAAPIVTAAPEQPVVRAAAPVLRPVTRPAAPALLPVAETTASTAITPFNNSPARPSTVVASPPPFAAPSPQVAPRVEVAVPALDSAAAPVSRPDAFAGLTIYNIITPNGDGKNDRFELPLPAGTCRLTVFDLRNNREVFSAERYDNSWDGGTLPAGRQYLYLIEHLSSGSRKTGFVTIER